MVVTAKLKALPREYIYPEMLNTVLSVFCLFVRQLNSEVVLLMQQNKNTKLKYLDLQHC